jgi:predicted methyltransferase
MARGLTISVLAALAVAGVAMAAVPANITAALGDIKRPPADSSPTS